MRIRFIYVHSHNNPIILVNTEQKIKKIKLPYARIDDVSVRNVFIRNKFNLYMKHYFGYKNYRIKFSFFIGKYETSYYNETFLELTET